MQDQKASFTEERELVKQARRGDVSARDELVRRHYQTALSACRKHAHKKGVDPDDALSEVFFTITEAIEGYDLRYTRTSFASYVRQRARGTITRADRETRKQDLRHLTTHWRKMFGGVGPPGKGFNSPRLLPEVTGRGRDALIGAYFRAMRNDAFERWLSQQCRRRVDRKIAEYLWLRIYPMSQAEIARAVGISRSAVSQRRQILFKSFLRMEEKDISNERLRELLLNISWGYCY